MSNLYIVNEVEEIEAPPVIDKPPVKREKDPVDDMVEKFKDDAFNDGPYYIMYFSKSHKRNRFFVELSKINGMNPKLLAHAVAYFKMNPGATVYQNNGITIAKEDFKMKFSYSVKDASLMHKVEAEKMVTSIEEHGYSGLEIFSIGAEED